MRIGRRAQAGIGVAGEYWRSGKTRAEFCREGRIPLTTLDYYLRRDKANREAKLLPVRVVSDDKPQPPLRGELTVILNSGRRVEVTPDFDEAALERLIAVLERR